MTIDEAIKHAEKVAEEKESEAQDLEYSKLDWRHEANQCSKCADEYRKLAEHLKELKAYKELGGDVISRQAVLDVIMANCIWENEYNLTSSRIKKAVESLPPIIPKQKVGRWIIKEGREQGYDIAGIKTWYIQILCSECGFIKTAIEGHIGEYKFCPKCGQPKM